MLCLLEILLQQAVAPRAPPSERHQVAVADPPLRPLEYARQRDVAAGVLEQAQPRDHVDDFRKLQQPADMMTSRPPRRLVTSGRDGLYERVAGDRREVANVIMNQLAGAGIEPEAVSPAELAKLIDARDRIPRTTFDEAIARVGDSVFAADTYIGEVAISDSAELDPIIDEILAANTGQVEAYRAGKDGLLGFFVGQVMKATHGKADPRVVNERVREKLNA